MRGRQIAYLLGALSLMASAAVGSDLPHFYSYVDPLNPRVMVLAVDNFQQSELRPFGSIIEQATFCQSLEENLNRRCCRLIRWCPNQPDLEIAPLGKYVLRQTPLLDEIRRSGPVLRGKEYFVQGPVFLKKAENSGEWLLARIGHTNSSEFSKLSYPRTVLYFVPIRNTFGSDEFIPPSTDNHLYL
jgi:hypothetical protein